MRLPSVARARPGLTLLEVLVALAIFLLALAGLVHLVTVAGNRALEAQYQTRAAELCQSKLAEVQAGAVPLSSQSDVAFDEAPEYHWSLDAGQGQAAGLYN